MDSGSADSPGSPVRKIPGNYDLPTIGAVIDGGEYFRGIDNFFKRRVEKYKSTVFRVYLPPDNRVIILLDCKSFPVLFDLNKVEKKNVVLGNYKISTDYTGGYTNYSNLDPSDEKHHRAKGWWLQLLCNCRERYFPEFVRVFDELSLAMEQDFARNGKAFFSVHIEQLIFNFMCRFITSADPVAPGPASLGTNGPWCTKRWLGAMDGQISSTRALPELFDELKIHYVPLPFCLVSGYHEKLYNFMWTNAIPALDSAEYQFGLNREEACNNLLISICGNAVTSMSIMFTYMAKYIADAGDQLQRDLAEEVRRAVEAHGGINARALASMPLVRSTVYEVLRIEPPAAWQYAKAKKDFLVESHDGVYLVKKGEMLCGYQPFATRDPKVFDRAKEFLPRRFMGEEGEKMLKHLLWSNGRETEETSADNKQCAGKDIVVTTALLFLAHFFLRYDTFAIEQSPSSLTFTALIKATL
jgi:hydroperoxide dehydratase